MGVSDSTITYGHRVTSCHAMTANLHHIYIIYIYIFILMTVFAITYIFLNPHPAHSASAAYTSIRLHDALRVTLASINKGMIVCVCVCLSVCLSRTYARPVCPRILH